MFKFLKDKLKTALSKITKKVEEEAPEEVVEQAVEQPQELIPSEEPLQQQKKETKQKQEKKSKEKKAKKDKKIIAELPEKEPLKKEKSELVLEQQPLPPAQAEPTPEKPQIIPPEEQQEEQPQPKKGFFARLFKKQEKVAEEIIPEEKLKSPAAEVKEQQQEPVIAEETVAEKKGFFGKLKEKIVTKKISPEQFETLFWELEVVLLENNVAVAVIDKIKTELKQRLVDQPLRRGHVEEIIQKSLKESIAQVLHAPTFDLIKAIREKEEKPYVLVFFGVNGVGKTTSLARVAYLLKSQGLHCALVAADTFRAGAREQLQEWGKRLDLKVISHDYGADPAAVCFDGITYGKQQELDVILIDTAGRQHSNVNLVKQMEKIVRVAKPDLKIFVGESITGNDAVEQADQFNKSIGIDAIILTKADVDDKGGAMISVSYITGKPILYLGTGQQLEDLTPFDPEKLLQNLGL